jgi:hypothetical protein
MAKRPPESKPLLRKIYEALTKHPAADGVRISISAPEELRHDDGSIYSVKYLCWNVVSGEEYITDPVLTVVHANLSEDLIRADLAGYFDGYNCVVDNDIHFSEK